MEKRDERRKNFIGKCRGVIKVNSERELHKEHSTFDPFISVRDFSHLGRTLSCVVVEASNVPNTGTV